MSVQKRQTPIKKTRKKKSAATRVLSAHSLAAGVVVAAGLFAAAMSYVIMHSSAAISTATLYTSPGTSQTVNNGQLFEIDIRINTAAGVPVKGASVELEYASDKIQVQSVSSPGSPYNTTVQEVNSPGVLHIERTAAPAVPGGDELFARVSFKAVSPGAAPIRFSTNSYVTSDDDGSNLPLQTNGVAYSISAPPQATTPQTSTPAGPGTPASPAAAPANGITGTPRSPQSSTNSASVSSPAASGEGAQAAVPGTDPIAAATQVVPVTSSGEGSPITAEDSPGSSVISQAAIAIGGLVVVAGLILGAQLVRTQLTGMHRPEHMAVFSTPVTSSGTPQAQTESKILEERLERLRNFPTTTLQPGAMVGPTDVSPPPRPAQPSITINSPPTDK